MPSLGEAPNGGARALGYLGLFQVTRCKSETVISHHRRNGYAPNPAPTPTPVNNNNNQLNEIFPACNPIANHPNAGP
ncbi:hypothetical protein QF010_003925 [Pseudomonas silensiensis]